MKKNLIKNKSVFYAGLVYLISISIYIGLRILWSFGFLNNLDPILNDLVFSVVLQIFVLTLIPFFLYKFLTKQTIKQTLDRFFVKKINLKTVIYSILLGIVTYIVIIFVSTCWSMIIQAFGYNPSTGASTTSALPTWLAFLLTVVSTSLLPGLGEETSHRGLLMGNASKNGLKRAILLSALMFALAHLNIAQFGYAFVVGLLLGSVTYFTRSIFPAMIIHATSNFISLYFTYAEANGWIGGQLFNNLSHFFANNIFVSIIIIFLVILLIIGLLYFLLVRIYVQARAQKIKNFRTRLYNSVKDTPMEKEIDFNNAFIVLELFNQATAKDLQHKMETGKITVPHLSHILDNSFNKMLYNELDEYQKINHFDYLFYYIAIFLTAITTFITFIWGLL